PQGNRNGGPPAGGSPEPGKTHTNPSCSTQGRASAARPRCLEEPGSSSSPPGPAGSGGRGPPSRSVTPPKSAVGEVSGRGRPSAQSPGIVRHAPDRSKRQPW